MSSNIICATIEDLPFHIGDGNYSGKYPKASEFVDKGIPFISASDFSDGRITPERFRFISAQQHSTLLKGHIRAGDVLLVTRGNGTGAVAWVDPKFDGCNINAQIVLLRSDEKVIHNRFLYYLLSSKLYKDIFNSYSSGSAQPQLPIRALKRIEIKYPSYEEQIEIATALSNIDDRISLLRETNTTLEAIAQALFKSWFVDFDPVRAKQEGREPEGMDADTAALFPDSFEESELGLVPSGWNINAVYDLAQYINGAAYKAFEPNSERRGLPIIKIAELKTGVTAQTAFSDVSMPEKYRIDARDILFSWSGNPDTSIDTSVWPHGNAWLNQHIFRVVPKSSNERSFVLLTLKYMKPVFAEIARNKQTTGLGHVTVADLKRLRVVKPNPSILRKWNEIVEPLIERAFIVEQQAQTLATLRNTLLPRLISGQLRLPDAKALIEETTA